MVILLFKKKLYLVYLCTIIDSLPQNTFQAKVLKLNCDFTVLIAIPQ